MVQTKGSAIHNVRVESITRLDPPSEYWRRYPLPDAMREQVAGHRRQIEEILSGVDTRMLMIVGPCSIHDTEVGLDYAGRLSSLASEVSDRVLVAMRVYFEKPRTTVGWKGLINDPNLNGTYDVHEGMARARQFLLEVCGQGLPTATEFLEPFTPQYLGDVISWGAIGARTTESQPHRLMASGLSMPIGFKNGTGGSIDIAVDGIVAARSEHVFLGIDDDGYASVVKTKGEPWGAPGASRREAGAELRRGVGGVGAGAAGGAGAGAERGGGLLARELEQGPQAAGVGVQGAGGAAGGERRRGGADAGKQHP